MVRYDPEAELRKRRERWEHVLDAEEDEQIEAMREWFFENFEDPAERTPYESKEGGYIWIWGGPYEADEELEGEFGGVVPDTVIEELAQELSQQCWQWAPTPKPEDYDRYIVDDIIGFTDHSDTFSAALLSIERLLETEIEEELAGPFHRMLYVGVVTAMETYLSDAFMSKVVPDADLMRKFVETTPEFQKEKIALADVYKAREELEERVKSYLADLVWHRLDRIGPMYEQTLGIKFPDEMGPLFTAITTRHDIVHRNGKTKKGEEVNVVGEDVRALIRHVGTFIEHVDVQIGKDQIDLDFGGDEPS